MNEITEQEYMQSLEYLDEPADNTKYKADTNIVPMRDWQALLHKTEKGVIKYGAYNVLLILHNDPEFKGLFKYDTRDRKSTRLNSSHPVQSRMPSSA